MANTDKINFNVSPNVKRDIERLANTHGKTLSAFMQDVCKILIDSNKDRIKEQAEREKQPLNFGGNVTTKKTRSRNKKLAQKADDSNEN